MATHTDPPKAPDTKPGAKPVAKDDLQTLPLAEVEKRLNSSPNGLTDAEAKKRLTQYGPNEIAEKKTNALLKFLSYFWGPIPWMIEVAVVLSADRSPLARLLHHSRAAPRQRDHRLLGRARGGQRDRRVEGAARDQGAREARRQMDHAARERPGSRRRDPPASGRHRSRRRASAGRATKSRWINRR